MNDRIRIKAHYQPSTNLLYDRSNKSLLDGFIPTNGSLDVMEFIIRPTLTTGKGTFRSHLLTGGLWEGEIIFCTCCFISIKPSMQWEI